MKLTILIALLICSISVSAQTKMTLSPAATQKWNLIATLIIQTDFGHVAYKVQHQDKGVISKHDVEVFNGDSIIAYCDYTKWVIRDTMATIKALNQSVLIILKEQQKHQ